MAGAELYYSRTYYSFSLFQVVARGWLEQSSTTPGHTIASVYFRWSPGDGWSRAPLLQDSPQGTVGAGWWLVLLS